MTEEDKVAEVVRALDPPRFIVVMVDRDRPFRVMDTKTNKILWGVTYGTREAAEEGAAIRNEIKYPC